MKNKVCVLFLCFIAGCMVPTDYSNPHLDSIKAEGRKLDYSRTAILEEYAIYNQNFEYWQQLRNKFMRNLTVEELTAYERLCSTPIDNVPQMVLNQRLLLDILPEEKTTEYWSSVRIGADIGKQKISIDQKAKVYNERLAKHNQNVQLGVELIKIQMQQSAQQNQLYRQNYYNQQRLNNQ